MEFVSVTTGSPSCIFGLSMFLKALTRAVCGNAQSFLGPSTCDHIESDDVHFWQICSKIDVIEEYDILIQKLTKLYKIGLGASNTYMHSNRWSQFEGGMAVEADAVFVKSGQVGVQFLAGVEIALLARIAIQPVLQIVMFSHFSFQFSRECNDLLAVVAFGVEAEMRHHFGIHITDYWTFRPQLAGVAHGYKDWADSVLTASRSMNNRTKR